MEQGTKELEKVVGARRLLQAGGPVQIEGVRKPRLVDFGSLEVECTESNGWEICTGSTGGAVRWNRLVQRT